MTINIIDTGNVAYHIAKMVYDTKEYHLVGVCGISLEKVDSLSLKKDTKKCDAIAELPLCDITIICVPDDKIRRVGLKISKVKSLAKSIVVHTSGSVSSTSLKACKKYGVWYPLQTFTKGQKMRYSDIPICITASSPTIKRRLKTMAQAISKDVRYISDKERKEIHLSAVLVNNMINHIIHLSGKRLEEKKIDADILFPLIQQTIKKLSSSSALDAQTGPARRGDSKTIEQHKRKLARQPELLSIYQSVTESILKTYHS